MSHWKGAQAGVGGKTYGHAHVMSLPEPKGVGGEINVLSCGQTHIILQIETQGVPADMRARLYGRGLNEGTAILLRLSEEFKGTKRLIVGDSRFSSVESAVELMRQHRLSYIGVVKSATVQFPMKELLSESASTTYTPFHRHAKIDGVNLVAFGYYDEVPHTLVSTKYIGCLDCEPGPPQKMPKFKPLNSDYQQHKVPDIIAEYRRSCGAVDHHNQLRQSILGLENNFHTHSWWVRFYHTLLSMIVVNAFLAYNYFLPDTDFKATHLMTFTRRLCASLAKPPGMRARHHAAAAAVPSPRPAHSLWPPIVHTVNRLKDHPDFPSVHGKQLRCAVCSERTTRYCVTCFQRVGRTKGICDMVHDEGNCIRLHSLEFE